MHLVNGTGCSPPLGRPTRVVKQDKSSGCSVDTTKTRSDPRKVGMCRGERPVGAAKGKQTRIMASCQSPPLFPATVCNAFPKLCALRAFETCSALRHWPFRWHWLRPLHADCQFECPVLNQTAGLWKRSLTRHDPDA